MLVASSRFVAQYGNGGGGTDRRYLTKAQIPLGASRLSASEMTYIVSGGR